MTDPHSTKIDRDHPLVLPVGFPRPPYIVIVMGLSPGDPVDLVGLDSISEVISTLHERGQDRQVLPLRQRAKGRTYIVMEPSELVN